jgi:hypothetical protein
MKPTSMNATTTENMQELTTEDLRGVAGGDGTAKGNVAGGWGVVQGAAAAGGGPSGGITPTDIAGSLATLILTAGLVH